MFLYHYSAEPREVLITSRKSVKRTPEKIAQVERVSKLRGMKYSYLDHISFFFEALPRDLGSLYKGIGHPLWKPGQVLYEHVIDTSDLIFAFDVVETPEKQDYMKRNWSDHLLRDDADDEYAQYFRRQNVLMQKLGYSVSMGKNNDKLEKVAFQFVGKARNAYIQSIQTSHPEDLKTLYAPGVPHAMIYPEGSEIELIEPANRIKLT